MKSSLLLLFATAVFGLQKRDGTISNPKTPPVTVKGNAFFANGKRFYIRGLDYQPGGSSNLVDPLSNPTMCKRDIEKFKSLGINTVRIYTVDNQGNHDECMKLLADSGIYLALDVNSPAYSLNRENAGSIRASYNDVYLQNVFATIDVFQKYDNTLLFFSANEVIDKPSSTFTAPYIKAVIRDMKNYMRTRGYRAVPVGYSAADVSSNRWETATYLNCGGNEARSDFFAFNDYSWCSTDFQKSGWDKKVEQYKDYSIPFFMSEFGCNENPPRNFGEIEALYSNKMTPVYSGGLVYEYTQEANNYGLVKVSGSSVQEMADFKALKAALAKTPAPGGDGGYKADGKPSECPSKSDNWLVQNNSLPNMPSEAKKYFDNGAGAGPGIKTGDKGSQWAGTPSSGWGDAKNVDSSNNKKKNEGINNTGSAALFGLSVLVVIAGLL